MMKFVIYVTILCLFLGNGQSYSENSYYSSYDRPKLDYTRVLYNCVDRIMHTTDDHIMKNFYFNINNKLTEFLKMVRANEVSLSEFQHTAKSTREEYLTFKRKLAKNAKKCNNWRSFINLNAMVNYTENLLGFMENLEQENYRALGNEDTLSCLDSNFDRVLWCTEKNIKRIFVPVYRPKDDPNLGRPAREQLKKKKIELPYTSRCGTSLSEMVECTEGAYHTCSFAAREGAVSMVKALTKYSEFEQPECYDLSTFLTFDAIIKKLMKISL